MRKKLINLLWSRLLCRNGQTFAQEMTWFSLHNWKSRNVNWKDLLIFLLAIWVKVLNFMIYPFERQFNAEIPSSFYQAIFHYFQRFLLRGEKIFVILRFWCFKNGERQKQLSGNISRRFHSIWFYSPAIHPSLPASLTMSPSKSSPSIQLLKISSKSQHVGRNCQQSPKCRIFGNCHQCQSFLKY